MSSSRKMSQLLPGRSPVPCEAAFAVITKSRLVAFRPAQATSAVVRSWKKTALMAGDATTQMRSEATAAATAIAMSVGRTWGSFRVGPARKYADAEARPPETIRCLPSSMTWP